MDKRKDAKRLLAHYMKLAFAESGLDFDADNYSDMDLLVDLIVDAAKEEILQELEKWV